MKNHDMLNFTPESNSIEYRLFSNYVVYFIYFNSTSSLNIERDIRFFRGFWNFVLRLRLDSDPNFRKSQSGSKKILYLDPSFLKSGSMPQRLEMMYRDLMIQGKSDLA